MKNSKDLLAPAPSGACAETLVESDELFYIMSPYGPCGNSASWWAIDGHGYTADLNKAWKVSRKAADDILRMKRGDQAFSGSEIDALAQRHFDIQDLCNVRSRETEVSNAK